MAKKKKKEDIGKKLSRVEDILEQFNSISGNSGSITLLGEDSHIQDIPVISSGIIALDQILGVGGYPQGRIIEIFGLSSGGKTTCTLHALASCQKSGGIGAFLDLEHSLSMSYAEKLGVDVKKLLFSQPDSAEQALTMVEQLSNLLGHGDMIVIDSVAALTPAAEMSGKIGDSHMGLQARLMSQAMRKLNGVISNSGVTVIFINQIRNKIGVMFGSNETVSGGNALKFYASQRIDVRRGSLIKRGEEPIGCKVKLKVVKNKVASPFRSAEPEMRFGDGIPLALECLNLGIEHGLVENKGAYYYFNDQALGQGKENAYQKLKESPEALKYIEDKLREILFKK
jgi:recombination protein RecA